MPVWANSYGMEEILIPLSHLSLRHLYLRLFRIEKTQGDKSGGRTYFMRGIQGEVCRPVWNRDYLYLLGLVQQVLTNLDLYVSRTDPEFSRV